MAKQGFKVMDSDMHVMEPPDLWPRYIDAEFRDQAPVGLTSVNVRDLRTVFPGETVKERPARLRSNTGHHFDRLQEIYRDHASRGWTADCQLEAMDVEGIDVGVLFPTRGLSVLTLPNIAPLFAAAIARAYNDWMFDFCKLDPKRLIGAGMLSVYDIKDAIEEARRAKEELGFRAVFLRSNVVNGTNWYDPEYEPLWATLEELDMPLGFHEATGSRSRQTGDWFDPNFGIRQLYSQPFEQMLGLGAFICGGVLARHPNLRVAVLEANCSWVPWLLWRMDEGYERQGEIYMADLKMEPSKYFMRQCVVSVEPDEVTALPVMESLGHNLVFSTDYPHVDSRYPDAVDSFLELPISDEDKRLILWDNCARFYSVDVDPAVPSASSSGKAVR
ncbi:MAG: putative TIM-barrel fold metal-dependent hydrolase [Chloroflexi bacterium]|nr:putative TIM-barrel fold metal-dependent hydrolase [Chloroflexota bacterium]